MAKPKNIRKVADGRSKSAKLLIYGDPGIGKTRLAGTSPKALIVRPPLDHTDAILDGDAEEWVVRDWDEMWKVYEYIRHEGAETYDWVWLDSISLFQDQGLDDIWETVINEKPQRARYGLDKAEYGINMHRLGLWVRHLVGLADEGSFNFGVTAHPRELRPSEDPGADEKLMPWVQGKNMAPKICGYMNVVAFYETTKKGTRVLRTQPSDRYYAKDQFDAFEDGRVFNPTIPEMMAAIEKARPKSSNRRRAPRSTVRKTTKRR